ncbi:MAG: hypothetical protein ACOWWR_10795 [Eubacteriales bacterium]
MGDSISEDFKRLNKTGESLIGGGADSSQIVYFSDKKLRRYYLNKIKITLGILISVILLVASGCEAEVVTTTVKTTVTQEAKTVTATTTVTPAAETVTITLTDTVTTTIIPTTTIPSTTTTTTSTSSSSISGEVVLVVSEELDTLGNPASLRYCTTEQFTINNSPWTVYWEYSKTTNFPSFYADVYEAGGTLPVETVQMSSSQEGQLSIDLPAGDYYMIITNTGISSYTLTVTE